ncbi:MAG: electron transfer flavoprotein subunit beta/FixA family protein [Desulfobacteria bacterium]
MSLDIVVCIKQVPDPEYFSRITIDPVKQTIRRDGIPTIINPLDKHALEEGLKIKEKFSGKVTAVTMGPPSAREVLEEALALGIDDAVLLCDRAFAGADTLATAYPLASGIKKLGNFDLILCGNETVDGATGQVGPQLAELLGIPHVTFVNEIEWTNERDLIVKSTLERGYMKLQVTLPVLLSVVKEINEPRLPTVLGIMEATEKEIKFFNAKDIDVREGTIGLAGSPTRVADVFEHKSKRKGEIIEGLPEDAVKRAVKRLRELKAI